MASGSQVGPEWVSISDLMSGVVGLLVVLFAAAALQVTAAEPIAQRVSVLEGQLQDCQDRDRKCQAQVERCVADRQALEATTKRADAARRVREQAITAAFLDIERVLRSLNLGVRFEIDATAHRIRMPEATFASGSAEIKDATPAGRQTLRQLGEVAPRLREVLELHPDHEVFVEGHTDSDLVQWSGGCARFDDNYTLSTARAARAREIVVAGWPAALMDRVALAGYGASRPIPGASKAAQRRVEIIVRERAAGAVP